jgi:hypothetical protein
MIRPLRQRHRVMVCMLGVVLPVAFAVGLVARKPVPMAPTVSAGLTGQGTDFDQAVWTKVDLWPRQQIITSLRREPAGSVAVELMFRHLAKPDVLVYWAAGPKTAAEELPDSARLLGALANRSPLPIPADVRGESGRFLLYSLADHEVVAASQHIVVEKD